MQPFDLPTASFEASCVEYRASATAERTRVIPEETPVALVYDSSTEAVMMATPADLEDFAIGFSLTEGLIDRPSEVEDLSVLHSEAGIELRMWLAGYNANAYRTRRRRLTGPTGCGLCGIESLTEAIRPARVVGEGRHWHASEVAVAVASLADRQLLHRQTHATHAAAFIGNTCGTVLVREDVGRHNALDKLAGAIARSGLDASQGALVITSRVSVEMVQKAAAIGAPLLIAVSAPTALAVRTAEAANLTLIGVARQSEWELYTHARRILFESASAALQAGVRTDETVRHRVET